MGSGYYTTLQAILKRHGCEYRRQGKGSHEIWHSPITQRTFPVSVTITSRHLANAILKQAGIAQQV